MNGNEPNQGNITEEKESELQDFIDDACVMISVLGYKVFEPLVKQSVEKDQKNINNTPLFIFQGKYDAQAIITNEGFVLLKGSEISPGVKSSMRESSMIIRNSNKDKISNDFILLDDILFTSSSAAACFVGGCSLSGNAKWRTKDGKSPKDFNF